MRSFIIIAAAVAALASASSASAFEYGAQARTQATRSIPAIYKLDTAGRCHDGAGKFVTIDFCRAAPRGPHCSKGKPCGNTCIKVSDMCHRS